MKCKYFHIKELVSGGVYEKYGEGAWKFLDERLLETLDALREFYGEPILVNNWNRGGSLSQRGYRGNKDPMLKKKRGYYCSQHCMGRAVDFNVLGKRSNKEIYNLLVQNIDKFPHIRRIEHIDSTPNWIHIDLANTESNSLIIFRG